MLEENPFVNPYYLFNTGKNFQAYKLLGSHIIEGKTVFRVWAPNAVQVDVVGDFNNWCEGALPLRMVGDTGIWEGETSEAKVNDKYKYLIYHGDSSKTFKADPMARKSELRPNNASVIIDEYDFTWHDADFIKNRPCFKSANHPINIYEVHLGSWKKHYNGDFYNYRELAEHLADYVIDMNYNYIELMPIMEHPLDASWGYQVTGFFAPTSRFGSAADFQFFVDYMHQRGIGIILDWVPAHFPKDEFGLYKFDGTPTYESIDSRMAEQPEWGTMIFDFSRAEVRSFLYSSAQYWLDEFHIDGLRYDAVSTILYRNYGSSSYVPNIDGGRENYEGITFLQELNSYLKNKFSNVLLIAEESTTWPYLTKTTDENSQGIGFDFKWDMGWMHDTLDYMSMDYLYRPYHHNLLTFSMSYFFSERFVLSLSHDEVVHGKKSLVDKMFGDYWRKFANLRALFAYMIAHPGIKLSFMGNEFAQFIEWRFYEELEWFMLKYDAHKQMQDFVREINKMYLNYPALWEIDTNWEGFYWINPDDSQSSVYSFVRKDLAGNLLIVLVNFTPNPVLNYRFGVPVMGKYFLILNSDEAVWGGSSYPIKQRKSSKSRKSDITYNTKEFWPSKQGYNGLNYSMTLDLPPLSAIFLYKPCAKKRSK